MRLITKSEVLGALACWAVRQSPYIMPDGLREALTALSDAVDADFHDGVPSLPMRWFASPSEIDDWLRRLEDHPQFKEWNTPKSKHGAPFVASSRYFGPASDDDFIDLRALWWNVAQACWKGSQEQQSPTEAAQ